MARLVLHEQAGPYRIDPAEFPTNGKAIFICGCGLSARMPYCDGTHKTCKAEQPGKVYLYDPITRQVIEERDVPPDTQPPETSPTGTDSSAATPEQGGPQT